MANIEDFESAPPGDDTRPIGVINIMLSPEQLEGLLNNCAVVHNQANKLFIIVQLDNGINQPIRTISEFNQKYMRGTND